MTVVSTDDKEIIEALRQKDASPQNMGLTQKFLSLALSFALKHSECIFCTYGSWSIELFVLFTMKETKNIKEFKSVAEEQLGRCCACVEEYHCNLEKLFSKYEKMFAREPLMEFKRIVHEWNVGRLERAIKEGQVTNGNVSGRVLYAFYEVLKYADYLKEERIQKVFNESLDILVKMKRMLKVRALLPGIFMCLMHPNKITRGWAMDTVMNLKEEYKERRMEKEVFEESKPVLKMILSGREDSNVSGEGIVYANGISMIMGFLSEEQYEELKKEKDFINEVYGRMKKSEEFVILKCFYYHYKINMNEAIENFKEFMLESEDEQSKMVLLVVEKFKGVKEMKKKEDIEIYFEVIKELMNIYYPVEHEQVLRLSEIFLEEFDVNEELSNKVRYFGYKMMKSLIGFQKSEEYSEIMKIKKTRCVKMMIEDFRQKGNKEIREASLELFKEIIKFDCRLLYNYLVTILCENNLKVKEIKIVGEEIYRIMSRINQNEIIDLDLYCFVINFYSKVAIIDVTFLQAILKHCNYANTKEFLENIEIFKSKVGIMREMIRNFHKSFHKVVDHRIFEVQARSSVGSIATSTSNTSIPTNSTNTSIPTNSTNTSNLTNLTDPTKTSNSLGWFDCFHALLKLRCSPVELEGISIEGILKNAYKVNTESEVYFKMFSSNASAMMEAVCSLLDETCQLLQLGLPMSFLLGHFNDLFNLCFPIIFKINNSRCVGTILDDDLEKDCNFWQFAMTFLEKSSLILRIKEIHRYEQNVLNVLRLTQTILIAFTDLKLYEMIVAVGQDSLISFSREIDRWMPCITLLIEIGTFEIKEKCFSLLLWIFKVMSFSQLFLTNKCYENLVRIYQSNILNHESNERLNEWIQSLSDPSIQYENEFDDIPINTSSFFQTSDVKDIQQDQIILQQDQKQDQSILQPDQSILSGDILGDDILIENQLEVNNEEQFELLDAFKENKQEEEFELLDAFKSISPINLTTTDTLETVPSINNTTLNNNTPALNDNILNESTLNESTLNESNSTLNISNPSLETLNSTLPVLNDETLTPSLTLNENTPTNKMANSDVFHSISILNLGTFEGIHDSTRKYTLDELVNSNLKSSHSSLLNLIQEKKSIYSNILLDIEKLKNEFSSVGESNLDLLHRLDCATKDQKKIQNEIRELNRSLDDNRFKLKLKILNDAQIICSTLSASAHDILKKVQSFDLVIVDEACQAVELSTLIPLKYNPKKVILVGDPNQLPPTVFSMAAQKFQYEQSLFQRLSTFTNPILLSVQYRMHPDISAFPREYFYQNKLDNGINMKNLCQQPWHSDPMTGPYLFFNVDGKDKSLPKKSFLNHQEALVACKLVAYLLKNNPKINFESRIAIITPYREQRNELNNVFSKHFGQSIFKYIQIGTVDGFQGQEKDIIIFSCVRAHSGILHPSTTIRSRHWLLERHQKIKRCTHKS
ncbi:hypothetical protein ROZALSC1DRAFT_27712 [Rozella allomycis CSF55]|uniref:Uncharacterized protein n=1 Tax=Rozella allomycis (strain CSF55) TaxID=988480 RepID=A0A4P9YMQ6_ROZAC|nr:hypothetical protein ROZALSC1DRAFT_27712 [Rozella allomycis CSF55]